MASWDEFTLLDPVRRVFDPAERDRLIKAAFFEAGGEPDEGIAAVVHTALNRLKNGRFGPDLSAILTTSQFNGLSNPAAADPDLPRRPGYDRVAAITDKVLAGEVPDPTEGATHFVSPANMPEGREPSWAAKMARLAKIGGHQFYREDRGQQVAQAASEGASWDEFTPVTSFPPHGSRTPDGSLVVHSGPPKEPEPGALSPEQLRAHLAQSGTWVEQFGKAVNSRLTPIFGLPGDLTRAAAGLVTDVPPAQDFPGTTDWLRKQGAKVNVTDPPGVVRGGSILTEAGNTVGNALPSMLALPALGAHAAVQAARPALGSAADIVKSLATRGLQSAVTAPKTTAAVELGTAAASGAAGELAAREFPENAGLARPFGELAGGLAGAGAVGAVTGVAGSPLVQTAWDTAKVIPGPGWVIRGVQALRKYAYETPTERARDRVRANLADPDAAVTKLETDAGGKVWGESLTPSQVIGEPGLMAMEKSIRATSPSLEEASRKQILNAYQETRLRIWEGYGGTGSEPLAQTVARQRADFEAQVQARIDAAQAEAQARTARLGGGATPADSAALRERAARDFRATLDTAEGQVRNDVAAAWQTAREANADVVVTPHRGRARYQELMEELSPAKRAHMPPIATRFLGPAPGPRQVEEVRMQDASGRWTWTQPPQGFGGVPLRREIVRGGRDPMVQSRVRSVPPPPSETFNGPVSIFDLQDLRSELLKVQRRAAAGTGSTEADADVARIAGEVADALLDDMGAQAGNITTPGGAALRAAMDASRVYRDRFDRGPVGDLLGRTRAGGDATDDALSLSAGGLTGERGAVFVQEAVRAAQLAQRDQDAPLLDAVDRHLRTQFKVDVIDPTTGEVKPATAEAFFRANNEVLALRPALAAELRAATAATRTAKEVLKTEEEVLARYRSPDINVTALFIKKSPDEAVATLMGKEERYVREQMANLRAAADADPTGRATRGLKESFANYLFDAARPPRKTVPGDFDLEGEVDDFVLPSGERLSALLRDPKTRMAMQSLFTADEIRRWQIGANTLRRIDTYLATPPDSGTLKDVSSTIEKLASRVLGGRAGTAIGRAFGVGGIMAPAAGAEAMKKTTQKQAEKALEAILREGLLDRGRFITLMETTSGTDLARNFTMMQGWLYGNIAGWGETLDTGDEDTGP